jgi:hypothetical protein
MALDEKTLRTRLAFIRYVYEHGVDQAHRPHPFDTLSVLTLHDAAELFMHLALEHHDPQRKKQIAFMEYFSLLPSLSGRTPIERLNTARVGLKHSGVLPASSAIAEFPTAVLSFLGDNCHALLGIDFNRVSMVDLVRSDDVRAHLQSAEAAIVDGEGIKAMGELAIAFAKLTDIHELIGAPPEYLDQFPTAGRFWNTGEIGALRSVVSVLALGLDLRRWARFKRLVPQVVRASVGEVQYGLAEWTGDPPTPADLQFCLDFVVQSALRLEGEEP